MAHGAVIAGGGQGAGGETGWADVDDLGGEHGGCRCFDWAAPFWETIMTEDRVGSGGNGLLAAGYRGFVGVGCLIGWLIGWHGFVRGRRTTLVGDRD